MNTANGVESPSEYRAVVERDGVAVEVSITVSPAASYADQDELGEVAGSRAGQLLAQVNKNRIPPPPF